MPRDHDELADTDDDRPSQRRTPVGGVDYFEARIERLERANSRYAVDRALVLGVEGHPGRLGALEVDVKAVTARVGTLETWRTGLTAKIAIGIAIGTPIGGILTALAVRWLTK